MGKVSAQEIDEKIEKFWHEVESGRVKTFFVMYKEDDLPKQKVSYMRLSTGTIKDRRAYLFSTLREIFNLPDSPEKSAILFEAMMKIIQRGLKITENIVKED